MSTGISCFSVYHTSCSGRGSCLGSMLVDLRRLTSCQEVDIAVDSGGAGGMKVEWLGSLIPAVVPESRLEPFRVNYLKCRVSCAAEFQPKFHENFTEKKNRKQKQEKNHERPHTQQDQDKTISRPAMRSENRKKSTHIGRLVNHVTKKSTSMARFRPKNQR